jgi:ABC-type iron transport system FetAB permease component
MNTNQETPVRHVSVALFIEKELHMGVLNFVLVQGMQNILKVVLVNFVQNVAKFRPLLRLLRILFGLFGRSYLTQKQLGESFGQPDFPFGILVKECVVLLKYRFLPVDLIGICNN